MTSASIPLGRATMIETRCVVCGDEARWPFQPSTAGAINPMAGDAGEALPQVDVSGTLHVFADGRVAIYCEEHPKDEAVAAFRLTLWKLTERALAEVIEGFEHG